MPHLKSLLDPEGGSMYEEFAAHDAAQRDKHLTAIYAVLEVLEGYEVLRPDWDTGGGLHGLAGFILRELESAAAEQSSIEATWTDHRGHP